MAKLPLIALCLLVLNTFKAEAKNTQTLEDVLSNSTELSQFYGLVTMNPVASMAVKAQKVTVFAPKNLAFQSADIKREASEYLPLYHMVNRAVSLNELDNSLTSMAEGNPTLWISKVQRIYHNKENHGPKDFNKSDIYVNNAKIDLNKSNYVYHFSEHKSQVLHVIDDVLLPLIQKKDMSPGNPTALELLERFDDYIIGDFHIKNFWDRIRDQEKTSLFSAPGRNTFFIPVDDAMQITDPKSRIIDGKVIDGHVIPGQVLFTAPANEEYMYQTAAFTDSIKVTVSFVADKNDPSIKRLVRSSTVVGDNAHPSGAVISKIVHANIPLQNGVAHLIRRPLMVIDSTLMQFLESFERETDGPLHGFLQMLRKHDEELIRILAKPSGVYTIFAPSNEAWNDSNVQAALKNDTLVREILRMHVVEGRLSLSSIQQRGIRDVTTVGLHKKRLYMNVLSHGGVNYTLTVEGGGVNATVMHPDIAATNGIIHVIDRVLGVPCFTIENKLATDPHLNATYTLGKVQDFNSRLSKPGNFTYFVPRDAAWKDLSIDYPNLYNILFDPRNSYQTKQILERHLIPDKVLSISDLQQMANNATASLPASRDYLSLRIKGDNDKGYWVEWRHKWIKIFRPDVKCTNGIIHVIDKVFLQDDDIKLSVSGSVPSATSFGYLLVTLLLGVVYAVGNNIF